MSTTPTISLCMMTRDEGPIIRQAISSVRNACTEIIVVDTGSMDDTREIATALGARVVQHPWEDDFSTPRNVGLELATGDWVLVLDADEAIAREQLPNLSDLTSNRNVCFELTQRHYSNDHRLSGFEPVRREYPSWERSYKGFFESSLVRLFPNREGIRYEGRVHELVEPSITRIPHLKIARSEIRLHHYGHTPEVAARKNKHGLYSELGRTKTAEQPKDWKAFFELGVECNRPDRRDESVVAFRRSLELNSSYLPTWVNLGYVLTELGRYAEAIECLSSALSIDAACAEAHCNLGVAYLRAAKLARAEAHFREALRIQPKYLNAYLNLSRALAGAGRISEAILFCLRASELTPDNPRILAELGTLYALGSDQRTATWYLSAALDGDSSLTDVRQLLGRLGSSGDD